MKTVPCHLRINGEDVTVEVRPHWTLLYTIREKLGLYGAKYGCGTGECGACTILADGKPLHSCLTLAAQAEGLELTTIEGLGKGLELEPVQEAFVEYGAAQCGYCTPGMIMATKALLDENPAPSESEVREALSGNLCRCTGYVKIVEAILAAAEDRKGGVSK